MSGKSDSRFTWSAARATSKGTHIGKRFDQVQRFALAKMLKQIAAVFAATITSEK